MIGSLGVLPRRDNAIAAFNGIFSTPAHFAIAVRSDTSHMVSFPRSKEPNGLQSIYERIERRSSGYFSWRLLFQDRGRSVQWFWISEIVAC